MVDFNQSLSLGNALHRCHALDDQGLYWLEKPIAYDNFMGYAQLTRELKTPVQLGGTSMDRGRSSGPFKRKPAITSCPI
jgi:L-alanine-DL-glutamate epimerase-like enolase superfamily enzyme